MRADEIERGTYEGGARNVRRRVVWVHHYQTQDRYDLRYVSPPEAPDDQWLWTYRKSFARWAKRRINEAV